MEIIFQGPFTGDELGELLQTFRDIKQRDRARHFNILGNFEELTADELMGVLRSVGPPRGESRQRAR